MQRPKVEIVAKPLGLLDVMSLPLVTSFVSASINTVLDYFVSPSSYTIDLSRFFLGSDVALSELALIASRSLIAHSICSQRPKQLEWSLWSFIEPLISQQQTSMERPIPTLLFRSRMSAKPCESALLKTCTFNAHFRCYSYASKVVTGELNPAWEETAFVRIETEGLDEGDR